MIGLLGYSFCSDGNAIDPVPTNAGDITLTEVKNGIFDHLNVTKNVTFDYNSVIPEDWDYDTIMDATFEGNISAGNAENMSKDITAIRIKRRVKGDFNWMTIKEIQIQSIKDFTFAIADNLALYGNEYEYAFVPMTGDAEGNYMIESILSKFSGVFICDANTVMKIRAGVEYSGNIENQQIGVFQPYNRQYPVIVSNSIIRYQTGTIGGWVLPSTWEDTRAIDVQEVRKEKELLLNFLLNKKPKVIKDMNGNSWLVFFTGSPSISYDNNYGQGMMKIAAEWTEIGDVNSKDDLYNAGLIPTKR